MGKKESYKIPLATPSAHANDTIKPLEHIDRVFF